MHDVGDDEQRPRIGRKRHQPGGYRATGASASLPLLDDVPHRLRRAN